ncbi:hypothetical protein HY374_02420 [Candidatus Berkelbacteria bacterium]|nr:hypothetical protein [Candidatus Berkelbacteria bacterium]
MTSIVTHRTRSVGEHGQLNAGLLRSLVGHPHGGTLLHFWASTAPEHPGLIRTLGAWHERYRPLGLAFLSVHVPEYTFSEDPGVLETAARRAGIAWPVVNDRGGGLATRFRHHGTPHLILLNPAGQVVDDHLGDHVGAVETSLRQLLSQGGIRLPAQSDRGVHTHRFGTRCHPSSPTTYFGHERGLYTNADQIVPEAPTTYRTTETNVLGPALHGMWSVGREAVRSVTTGHHYLATHISGLTVFLVTRAEHPGAAIRLQLGSRPLPAHLWGRDVAANGEHALLAIHEPGLYQLVASQRLLPPTELRLYPTHPGIELYALHTTGCLM